MPRLKVGIYHLRFQGNDNPTLLDIVKTIEGLEGENRAAKVIDDPIRPRDNIHCSDEYCLLDFSRIPQVDQIPTSDLKGAEEQMTFGPGDKRPCKYTVVLLDPQSNTIYVHEGPGSAGVGHTTVAKYLRAISGLTDLYVEVVLHEKQGMDRLLDKKHRVFKIRLAGIRNAESMKAQGKGDEAILETLRVHKAPNATIHLGLERGPGQLDHVLETAAALLGWNNLPTIFGRRKPVKEILIGEGEEGEEHLVNLLDDRIVYSEELKLEPGETPTDADRHRVVKNAFDRYRTELRRRHPVDQDVQE